MHVALRAGIVLGLGWVALSCTTDPTALLIQLRVHGTGMGAGSVRANDPVVQLTGDVPETGPAVPCTFPGVEFCRSEFPDAGAGGLFSLTAAPAPGSRFSSWTGCNSVNGDVCWLSFNAAPSSFAVTARFDVAPGGVGLDVSLPGSGAGTVAVEGLPGSASPSLCYFVSVRLTNCRLNFLAAVDGTLLLQAAPAEGSFFANWIGCPGVNGNSCTLSYVASAANEFSVAARFEPTTPSTLTVHGAGAGSGTVSGQGLNCHFPTTMSCSITFPTNGDTIALVATPASANDVFVGWTGCSLVNGNTCTIAPPRGVPSTFDVTARFERTAGMMDSITLYNGTAFTINMVVGSETPGPGNSLLRSGPRSVLVPTAVGTAVFVRAYMSGEQLTSTACTVTAAAWQGALRPNVALFTDGGTYLLTCYNF